MAEFFLELFSEEIPPKLQINARKKLFLDLNNFFQDNNINIKGSKFSISTPNRIIISFSNVSNDLIKKSQEIKGPSVNSNSKALEGFLNSHNIKKSHLKIKSTERGEFYFYKKPEQKLKTQDLLKKNLPSILDKITWNKSMKWGNNQMFWGRPLKSILAVFDENKIEFNFHHLKSSNYTFVDKDFEEKTKKFINFKSYQAYFKSIKIILDQDKRKDFILNELKKVSKKKNLLIDLNDNLLNEITNIVEKPKIILCEFDKKFLNIPKEILIISMQNHQKYIPTFDKKQITTDMATLTREVERFAEDKKLEIETLKDRENYRKDFMGNVSHELKTPLFTVQGYILTLLDGAMKDKSVRKKYLQRANKGVERLIYIVKDLDMITKLEIGDLSLLKEEVDPYLHQGF